MRINYAFRGGEAARNFSEFFLKIVRNKYKLNVDRKERKRRESTERNIVHQTRIDKKCVDAEKDSNVAERK